MKTFAATTAIAVLPAIDAPTVQTRSIETVVASPGLDSPAAVFE